MASFSGLQGISDQGVSQTTSATNHNVQNQYQLSAANARSDIELNGQRMMVSFAAATGKNMKAIGTDAKDAAG